MKYYPEYDCKKHVMCIKEIDESKVELCEVSKSMKYRINKNYFVEDVFDTIEEAVDSLGLYFSLILLPNNEYFVR